MKKRNITTLLFIFFTFSFTWATWEGNAGVGSSGDFEENKMVVKSDMFPKNTIIEIINLENSEIVRAVVIGDSGVPGLLISLSPATAKKLNVATGKIVRVRVTTPNRIEADALVTDESYETDDFDYNPKKVIAKSEKEPKKPVSTINEKDDGIKATVFFDEASSKHYKTPKKPEPTVEPEPVVEPKPVVEPEPAITYKEDAYLEAAELRPPKNFGTDIEPKPNVEPTVEPVPATPKKIDEEKSKNQEAPNLEETYQPVYTVDDTQPIDNEEYNDEIKSVKEVETPIQPNALTPEAEKHVREIESPVKPTVLSSETKKHVTEVNTPVQPETSNTEIKQHVTNIESPTASTPVESETEKYVYEVEETNAPIYEVEKPKSTVPTAPTTLVPDVVDESDVYVVDDVVSQFEEENIQNEIQEPVINKPATKVKSEPVMEIEEYKLEDDANMYFGDLIKGRYYLQVASYKNELNVKGVLNKHSNFYPIAVQKTGSKKQTRYKVFVGPLAKDEMGAVMSRFYSFGFKDSFFKVIK